MSGGGVEWIAALDATKAGRLTDSVQQILQSILVKIGGKRDIPLADFLPRQCQTQLMEILEKYQEQLS